MLPGITTKGSIITIDRAQFTSDRLFWRIPLDGGTPGEVKLISLRLLPLDAGSKVMMAAIKPTGHPGETLIPVGDMFDTLEECVAAAKERLDDIVKTEKSKEKDGE